MEKKKQTGKLDAFGLFPGLMQKIESERAVQPKREGEAAATVVATKKERQPVPPETVVLPPLAPDLSWLRNGNYEDSGQDKLKDIPTALVLMKDGGAKDFVSSTLSKLGYQVETAETAADAIHRLGSTNYTAVVMHVSFEKDVSLAESTVHNYLAWLPMGRRRLIYYILVGAELHTLYDLEALSLSANLVVNNADVGQLTTILRKSFRDYEELFGPLLESLGGYGKM